MTSQLRHSAVQSDTLLNDDIVITSGCVSVYFFPLIFLFLFFFYCIVTLFMYKDCLLLSGERKWWLRTFHRKRTLKSANVVCVYLFVNTYTQNTPVKKRSVVHHLWQKTNVRKSTKKVSTSFISIQFSYEFMVVVILWLWISFTWLIGLHRAEWCWGSDQQGAIVREKRFLPTSLSTSHYCNSSWVY